MIAWVALLQLTIAVAGPATSPEYLPLHVARAEGLFAREGLQVSLLPARAEAPAAEALAEGRAGLAATSLDAALRLGHRNGAPPPLVFGLTAAPPVALLVPAAQAEAPRSPRDLAGRTVGIPGPGTPEHLVLLSLLARERVPVGKVTIASFGERGLARALGAGAVAAAVLGDPWATRLVATGQAAVVADFRRADDRRRWLGGETVGAAVFVAADDRASAPHLARLARALLAAVERVRSAPTGELAAELPADVVGGPEDFAVRLAGARGIYLDRGRVSVKMLEASVDLARERFPIPQKVKLPRLAELLLPGPLDEALGGPAP